MTNQGFNVLIVDDNEMNRDTLARRLKQQGFATAMAANGREALNMANDKRYDLILLDIMMPEVDGYEVLLTLKSSDRLRNIPVIMISAIEEIESVMKCMEMGAEDYLTKPFDPVLLQAAIARCLKKNPTLPPRPAMVGGQKTILQLGSTSDESKGAPAADVGGGNAEAMTIDEVVSRLVSANKISRKGYMHLSKSIFNALFNNRALTEKEFSQINLVFNLIQVGQIKIID